MSGHKIPARFLPFLLVGSISACSPVYVYKSAAGHARLLWRRERIEKALADPRTPPETREKLKLVLEVREFAFGRMGLKPSRDYGTVSRVEGPALSYLVSGSEKTRFEPYIWRFPLVGSFPYKGYYAKKDALREKEGLERRGYDACVAGAAAYNIPLLFSNPLPSTALEGPPGELASLLIHELTHGTVWFKSQVAFNEALATFAGEQGARDFLESRYGPDSKELADFRRFLERQYDFAAALDELYGRLDKLYRGPGSEEEKLKAREELFRTGEARLKELGFEAEAPLNNAAILAQRLYREDLGRFEEAYERNARDWPRTIGFFRSLDRKRPGEDMSRKLAPRR